jgi:predicted nucleic acid-binding protein
LKAFIDANLLIYLNTVSDHGDRAVYEGLYMDIITDYKPYIDVLVLDELLYYMHLGGSTVYHIQ